MTLGFIAHSVFRFIQLVLALTVCGLYGVDLHRANQEHKYSDGKWVCLFPSPSHPSFPAFLRPCTSFLSFSIQTPYFILPNPQDTDAHPKVYAEVTASLSAITAVLYLIPLISRIPLLFIWDLILFILWIALFGIFGKMYIGTRVDDWGIQRMKNAVWVDLVNALLWLLSAGGMAVYWWRQRRAAGRSRWTGRAVV